MFVHESRFPRDAEMKFRWGFFNRVKSDTGFVVKIRAIAGFVEYREGDHCAVLPIENNFFEGKGYLSRDTTIKWKPPHESELMPEEKRIEILTNVFEALKFARVPIEMV